MDLELIGELRAKLGAVWPIGLLYIIIFGEVNRHAAGTAKFIEQGPLDVRYKVLKVILGCLSV